MGLSLKTNNKIFLVAGILFQLWFIIIYAINYQYKYTPNTASGSTLTSTDFSNMFQFVQGMIMVVFLLLLFFLGNLFNLFRIHFNQYICCWLCLLISFILFHDYCFYCPILFHHQKFLG